ncbi:MAG: VOC family protein [Actinobacteria bacterium]|nr:VOC family protein [Actinomycetota bacterium]
MASEAWGELWPRYRGELGGTWVSGDEDGPGFAPAQVRYANNMKIEVLMPHRPEQNDFLRRFLDRRGPGPHHVTFKVPSLTAAIGNVETAGYRPVGVDLRDPTWQEAFIHPKDGPGIVVQLAEAPVEWSSPPPSAFPPANVTPPASFDYIGLAVADLARATELFVDLLDGEQTSAGRDDLFAADYVELGWSSGGRIRLFTASQWIAEGANGAMHHAAFTVPDASAIADAMPLDDGRFEVAPENNFGVRLVLATA